MLAVVLALVSAVSFGASDYAAGLATRAASVLQVTLVAQVTSLVLALLVVPWVSPLRLSAASAGWGAVGGVAGVFGAVTLYVGFRHAVFSVASTLSAVGAAALPAIVAISAGPGAADDVPPAAGGAVTGRRLAGVGYGVAAGACFALYFIAFSRTGSGSGLWPVIVAEAVSLPVLVGCALSTGQLGLPPRGSRSLSVATGVTGAAGAIFYFVASHHGLLAVTAVITSLYPGATILLARIRPGERLSAVRLAGLALAGAAVALIAVAGVG